MGENLIGKNLEGTIKSAEPFVCLYVEFMVHCFNTADWEDWLDNRLSSNPELAFTEEQIEASFAVIEAMNNFFKASSLLGEGKSDGRFCFGLNVLPFDGVCFHSPGQ